MNDFNPNVTRMLNQLDRSITELKAKDVKEHQMLFVVRNWNKMKQSRNAWGTYFYTLTETECFIKDTESAAYIEDSTDYQTYDCYAIDGRREADVRHALYADLLAGHMDEDNIKEILKYTKMTADEQIQHNMKRCSL